MPGGRQRQAQPRRPEGAQAPQGQGESHRTRLAGQTGDTVDRVTSGDVVRCVIRGDKSGKKGISPRGEPS
ncbi:hypothetical protein GCM10010507_37080 [Streptomyces cinnamoneus]|uniref:Uncharacterized protein n=1 Tax=Streptomyces cinnamoneus TaxID=53446 RepID=A0A918TPY2_STRCJ|nr:hypothetical protein GCM10010507_37080 [Streptomyces cinnamoneus]